jgi:hypothetical protein
MMEVPMRTISLASILAAMLAGRPVGAQDCPKCEKCGTESYGTSIVWEGSPSEAAAKAKKEEKLVFVLHVSGYFEDPNFT